jgi:NADH-quinone oxidoreductase subunit N
VKFALVPFHMWAPDLFSGAPPSAASLAGAVSKVAVAVAFLRLATAPPGGPLWEAGLALAGGAAVLLGNLVALRQESLVRMLGYSSVAHSGYLALVLGAGHPLTGDVVLFYVAAYAPAVVAALCIAALAGPGATRESLRGLVWARPVAGVALGVALLSMAGLPPAAGFLAKVYMFTALAGAEAWLSLSAAALGSGLGFLYYLRFAVAAFAAPDGAGPYPALARPDALALAACLAALLVAGLYPEPLLALARAAAP